MREPGLPRDLGRRPRQYGRLLAERIAVPDRDRLELRGERDEHLPRSSDRGDPEVIAEAEPPVDLPLNLPAEVTLARPEQRAETVDESHGRNDTPGWEDYNRRAGAGSAGMTAPATVRRSPVAARSRSARARPTRPTLQRGSRRSRRATPESRSTTRRP